MKLIFIVLILIICFSLFAKPLPVLGFNLQLPMIEKDITLSDYINNQLPLVRAALIVGADSIAVGVTENEFNKIHIVNKNAKWDVVSDSLPLPVNIKNVRKIYLYYPYIVPENSKGTNSTRFQDVRDKADFLGQAEKNNYIVWKYRIHEGALQ
jgi:hypothetical protein